MKLHVMYNDYSENEFDLNEYMYIGGEHALTITKNIGREKYDFRTCETIVIPYSNIFKYWTKGE